MSEKTLFLGRDSLCGDEIARFPQNAAKPILHYPSMAALCFALAELYVGYAEKRTRCDDALLGPADSLGGY